jgi:hypothetical protein
MESIEQQQIGTEALKCLLRNFPNVPDDFDSLFPVEIKQSDVMLTYKATTQCSQDINIAIELLKKSDIVVDNVKIIRPTLRFYDFLFTFQSNAHISIIRNTLKTNRDTNVIHYTINTEKNIEEIRFLSCLSIFFIDFIINEKIEL